MTSSRLSGTSKIDKYNLEDVVIGLKAMGLSYNEICEDIQRDYKIALSKSNLTNFFNRVGEPQEPIDTTNECNTLSQVQYRVKNDVYQIRNDLKREF